PSSPQSITRCSRFSKQKTAQERGDMPSPYLVVSCAKASRSVEREPWEVVHQCLRPYGKQHTELLVQQPCVLRQERATPTGHVGARGWLQSHHDRFHFRI